MENRKKYDEKYRSENKEKISLNRKKYDEKYRSENKEKMSLYGKKYRLENKDKIKIYYEKTSLYRKERRRNYYLKSKINKDITIIKRDEEKSIARRYKLNIDEYRNLFEKQNNLCAICNLPNIKNKRLCVDHCHKTGRVRGLLCHWCNTALGYLHDNPELLKKALDYLQK
jgi:hypothetical protein